MGGETFVMECSTVPTVVGSDVNFAIKRGSVRQIRNWPLRYVECESIAPAQHRLQWGVNTFGPRYDSYKAFRVGSREYNLELGMRNTNSGGRLRRLEDQRVGVATLTLASQFRMRYWNDHSFWWWPMGGGTDQGDTAGLGMSYVLGNGGFPVLDGWEWRDVNLNMRLATGIPVKGSVVTTDSLKFYSEVQFSGVDRGDIDLNATLTNREQQRLMVGLWVNSGKLRNVVQSKIVHDTLNIPELPPTEHLEVMVYFKLEKW